MNARIPPDEPEQPSVWDGWATPSSPDENSMAAASSVLGSAGSLRRQVAAAIAESGPYAEWELEVLLHRSGNTIRPRVVELHQAGVIARVEEKGTTPSGRSCWLYAITGTGRRLLAER